MSGNAKKNAAH